MKNSRTTRRGRRNLPNGSVVAKLCAAGLSLLGFGCGGSEEEAFMYGTPTGSFEIKGKVTDADGKEVSGAEIRVTYPDAPSGVYSISKGVSGDGGLYDVEGNECYDRLKVVCEPGDDKLEPDSVTVEMDYVKNGDEGGSWYMGHAESTVNFNLKQREDSGK